MAQRGRHRAQRYFSVQHRVRASGHRAIRARRHPQHRGHLLLDWWPRNGALGGRQGWRDEHDAVPGCRMGAPRHPGELPCAWAVSAPGLAAGVVGAPEPRGRRQTHTRRTRRSATRIGLGGYVSVFSLRRVSDRSHASPRRRELAASWAHHARVRSRRPTVPLTGGRTSRTSTLNVRKGTSRPVTIAVSAPSDAPVWAPGQADTVTTVLARALEKSSDKVFLDFAGETYTYSQVWNLALRRAAGFQQLGVGPGDT